MKNSSHSIWIGLSFLVVGLVIGLVVSGQGGLLQANIAEESVAIVQNELEAEAGSETNPSDELNLEFVSVSEDDDAIKGDPDAPVTIIEFSDFQCPYCARFAVQTLPLLTQNYIDTGKVKLVYRDFPIPSHAQAALAAEANECVGQESDDLYFQMHDRIFAGVQEWSYNGDAEEILIGYANDLGVDISSCLANGDETEEVANDYTAAQSYGVGGTPTFFINGWKVVGAQPYEVFEALIERELNS